MKREFGGFPTKEAQKEYRKQYYEDHKEERKDIDKEYKKQYRENHKNEAKNKKLQRIYGVTLDQYNDQLQSQGGVCAICGKPETNKDRNGKTKTLAVDHDHKTGENRMLLCTNHNLLLGHADDSIEILESAITYLNKYKQAYMIQI